MVTRDDLASMFSAEDGLLRLPPDGIRALATWDQRLRDPQQPGGPPGTVNLLSELGAVGPDGLHPLLRPISAALARPLVRLLLRLGPPQRATTVSGWIVPGWAVFSLPAGARSGLRDVVAVHPTRLPGLIATVVSLGPRPTPGLPGPVILPTPAARALVFGQGGLDPKAVLGSAGVEQPWREALERLAALRILTWSARSRWPVGGEVAARTLRVIDGGEAGLWLWTDDTFEGHPVAQLEQVTSSVVWRYLTALLPDADDFVPSGEATAPQ